MLLAALYASPRHSSGLPVEGLGVVASRYSDYAGAHDSSSPGFDFYAGFGPYCGFCGGLFDLYCDFSADLTALYCDFSYSISCRPSGDVGRGIASDP
eukprot:150564-Pyramimonas_sp.AAC.1